MKRVLTAVVLIPIVLLLVLRAPVPVLAAAVAAVAVVTLREYVELVRHYHIAPYCRVVYVLGVVALGLVAALSGETYLDSTAKMLFGVVGGIALILMFFFAIAMRREPLSEGFPAASAAVFGFLYIVVPLAMLLQLREQGSGAFLILYTLIVVWMGDTVAYYIGRAIGRHKMAPRISPGKTWEGAAGSMIGAVVSGVLVFAYSRQISLGLLQAGVITPDQSFLPPLGVPSLWRYAVLSAVINVAAQIGDLAESLLKRGAGVKDSGSLLPGHGGMLDRIDALLFAAPVVWYYAALRILGS